MRNEKHETRFLNRWGLCEDSRFEFPGLASWATATKTVVGGFGVGTLFPSVLSHGLSSNFEPTPRRDPVERFAQPGHKYRKFIQIRGLSKTDPNTTIMAPLRIKVLKYATPKLRLLILATTSEYGFAASALQGSLQS